VVPIPGTRRITHLEENLKALDISLSAAEVEELSTALPPGSAAGERYPAETMKTVDI